MKSSLRLIELFCLALLVVLLPNWSVAQDSFVAKAKEVSAKTGRPILAVAGSNT